MADNPIDTNLTRFASDEYAKNVENHPYHRLLNRPALLSLMPTLNGLNVLDAGCGTGWFTEYFESQGATVTGLDISEKMVEKTRARVPNANVIQANLAEPLKLEDTTFDLILSSLTLQYLESWTLTFTEFQRILKANGLLIFSVHHPFEEFQLSGKNYFEIEKRERKGGQVSFRRALSAMTETLYQTGFIVERLLEPLPDAAYGETDPEGYEGLLKFPGLLVIRVRKN
jgi:ubiquinone/menaquinone biosynthesis C-methylase UbiE